MQELVDAETDFEVLLDRCPVPIKAAFLATEALADEQPKMRFTRMLVLMYEYLVVAQMAKAAADHVEYTKKQEQIQANEESNKIWLEKKEAEFKLMGKIDPAADNYILRAQMSPEVKAVFDEYIKDLKNCKEPNEFYYIVEWDQSEETQEQATIKKNKAGTSSSSTDETSSMLEGGSARSAEASSAS